MFSKYGKFNANVKFREVEGSSKFLRLQGEREIDEMIKRPVPP